LSSKKRNKKKSLVSPVDRGLEPRKRPKKAGESLLARVPLAVGNERNVHLRRELLERAGKVKVAGSYR